MQFTSPVFFIFIFAFFILWKFFRQNVKLRLIFLVAASFVFYGWTDWRYLLVAVAIGAIGFWGGILINKNEPRKRTILIFSIIGCLVFLFLFRYSHYFLGVLLKILTLFDPDIFLIQVLKDIAPIFSGLTQHSPLGVSFYTLQTISYLVDVYYQRIQPASGISHYFSYIFMFPKLLAGPIERGKNLLPQLIKENISTTEQQRWEGTKLIVAGYFMKVAIADNLAPFVNYAFDSPILEGGTLYWWIMVTAFAFQLYMDFAGYSSIARGLGKWMGFDLINNFNHPYISTSLGEFWNRWHISLSSWLRDYIFFPLNRSRFGKGKQHLNNLITMLASGLWHGAGLNFIFWGVLHAFYTSLERITQWPVKLKSSLPGRWLSGGLVLLQVWIGWVFFRSPSLQRGFEIIRIMFTGQGGFDWGGNSALLLVVGLGIFGELFSLIQFYRIEKGSKIFYTILELFFFALLIVISLFFRGEGNQFIYFQF